MTSIFWVFFVDLKTYVQFSVLFSLKRICLKLLLLIHLRKQARWSTPSDVYGVHLVKVKEVYPLGTFELENESLTRQQVLPPDILRAIVSFGLGLHCARGGAPRT